MIDKFELNKFNLPNLPCPHDCIIKKIEITADYLIFIFEDDLSYHNSIKYKYYMKIALASMAVSLGFIERKDECLYGF